VRLLPEFERYPINYIGLRKKFGVAQCRKSKGKEIVWKIELNQFSEISMTQP
jgi:hypothetical protein